MDIRKEIMKIAKSLMAKNILKPAIKMKINNELYKISTHSPDTYYEKIPLNDIFNALKKNGVIPIDDDGTEWSGFLAGREGRAMIDMADLNSKEAFDNVVLQLAWYKMGSGAYEVNVYIG
jgi:hypothetical protein